MIQGTPREANSFSPVPSAARPSRTARRIAFSFIVSSAFSDHRKPDTLTAPGFRPYLRRP